jgi:hypothetical protein
MGASFTPGPWRVDPRYASDIQTADGALEIAGVAATILTGGEKPELEARFANARLIAAAPELYGALDKLRNDFAAFMSDVLGSSDAEIANWLTPADAALAKARGDQ